MRPDRERQAGGVRSGQPLGSAARPSLGVFTVAFLVVGMPRFVVAAFTGTFAPLAVMMAIEGLACGVLNPIMATVMYETVPAELLSRVLSARTASVLVITPLGGLAAGFVTETDGLSTAMSAFGGLYLLATLCPVVFPVWRRMDASDRPSD